MPSLFLSWRRQRQRQQWQYANFGCEQEETYYAKVEDTCAKHYGDEHDYICIFHFNASQSARTGRIHFSARAHTHAQNVIYMSMDGEVQMTLEIKSKENSQLLREFVCLCVCV